MIAQLLDQFFIVPSERSIALLGDTLLFLSFIHFCYAGMAVGSQLTSLYLSMKAGKKGLTLFSQWAAALAEMSRPHGSPAIFFGIIPLLTMALLLGQLLHGSGLPAVPLLLLALVPLPGAFALGGLYLASFKKREENWNIHLVSGLGSALCYLLTYGLVFYALSGLQEYGAAHTTPGWGTVFLHFMDFICCSFAMTGGGIFFFFLSGPGKVHEEAQRQLAVKTASLLLGYGALVHMALTIFILATLPAQLRTVDLVGPTALMLLLLISLALMLYRIDLGFEAPLFVTVILIVFTVGSNNALIRETALRPHTKLLIAEAREAEALLTGTPVKPVVEDGATIFRASCASCHAYERRLTGPPFKEVLPLYTGKPAALERFIRTPRRVNRDYPPMPRPALMEDEREAVTSYLLGDYLKREGEIPPAPSPGKK
jgi:cytochrome c551/c552